MVALRLLVVICCALVCARPRPAHAGAPAAMKRVYVKASRVVLRRFTLLKLKGSVALDRIEMRLERHPAAQSAFGQARVALRPFSPLALGAFTMKRLWKLPRIVPKYAAFRAPFEIVRYGALPFLPPLVSVPLYALTSVPVDLAFLVALEHREGVKRSVQLGTPRPSVGDTLRLIRKDYGDYVRDRHDQQVRTTRWLKLAPEASLALAH